MKNNVFTAKVARHAAITTMVSLAAMSQDHSTPFSTLAQLNDSHFISSGVPTPEPISVQNQTEAIKVLHSDPLTEWTKRLEKEFRKLALAEATGSIDKKQLGRLEELSRLREKFQYPQTPEEILTQLRRDRIIEKMADTLREYAEFQEITSFARRTS